MPDIKSIEAAIELSQDESKLLGVKFGSKAVVRGEKIPKAEAQETPEISFNAPPGKYIIINIDLDAPFPSFPILGPILHWFQHDLTPTQNESGASVLKVENTPAIAHYAGPGPPPPSAPHRYVFMLYEQPADFDPKLFSDGKPMGIRPRMRYDYPALEKKAKLGPVIASNYFVSN